MIATEEDIVYLSDHKALIGSSRSYRRHFSGPIYDKIAVAGEYSVWVRYDGDIRPLLRNGLTKPRLLSLLFPPYWELDRGDLRAYWVFQPKDPLRR